jgi:hypothetical protein
MNHHITTEDITTLPLTTKEKVHTSRKRLGYHVYLSYSYSKFSSMTYEEQTEILVQYSVWPEEYMEDDASFNSILTPRAPQSCEVMKLLARKWQASPPPIKEGWKERAKILNLRDPNDGKFTNVPCKLYANLEREVLTSLSNDWMHFVSMMKSSIMRRSTHMGTSTKVYTFGKEKVTMNNQVYRSFHFNYLMELTMFGSNPSFSLLFPYEVVHRTKKQTIIHIGSHSRLSNLFTFGGIDASMFEKDGLKYVCCGKVTLKVNRDGRICVGYVIDETQQLLKIRIVGVDDMITIVRPKYNEKEGRYVYETKADDTESAIYSLVQFSPVRFKINKSGSSSYIYSRICLNAMNNIVL